MCTVTYLPLGTDQFILTSNRDEQPGRSPESIKLIREQERQLAFPPDQHANGSWIAIASDNRVVCLLNGAFVKHYHHPPYKRSRGTMVLDFFRHADANAFFAGYDFAGMEPFTMVIYDRGALFELRWDETHTHVKQLATDRPYLWSSATLYNQEMKKKRQAWFQAWLDKQTGFDRSSILDFHHHAGEGDPWFDVVMNRDGKVMTVSITSILKSKEEISMQYEDLLRNNIRQISIPLHIS